jgi:hypothetical protein
MTFLQTISMAVTTIAGIGVMLWLICEVYMYLFDRGLKFLGMKKDFLYFWFHKPSIMREINRRRKAEDEAGEGK